MHNKQESLNMYQTFKALTFIYESKSKIWLQLMYPPNITGNT